MDDNAKTTESIVLSVKKLVGIPEEDVSFDIDVMLNVNSAIATLYQLGVLQNPFTVTSNDDTYSDMFTDGKEDIINQIKMYLVYKTKIGFDGSGMTSSVLGVIKEMIQETEWRLMTASNPRDTYE